MKSKPAKAVERERNEREFSPEEIEFLLQGRVDDCCIS